METGIEKVGRPAGQDYSRGHGIDQAMVEEGLTEVDSMEYHHTALGGSVEYRSNGNHLAQTASPLRALGIGDAETRRLHELLNDPRLRIRFFPFVCVRDREPEDV